MKPLFAVILLTGAMLQACTPIVIGTGAAIIADEVIEQRTGDDGLF